ncbi:hypothetical protein [Corynebacterium hadale]|uniref:hypothetical protein n=1 Tax=Corynebacterium hadale TaxID=2026255 RepID=UPI000BAA6485|nr:hypothetical protein [Corynebacterium hadale]PAT08287.1 hypothetical protein CKJ82_05080 [Corynebacterium hadale]
MRTSYLPAFSAAALAAAALVAPHATAAELAPKGEASCTLTMTAAERAYADSFKSEEKDLGGKRIAGTWVRAIEDVYPEASAYNDLDLLQKVMPRSLAEHYLAVRGSEAAADVPFGPTAEAVAGLGAVNVADSTAAAGNRENERSLTQQLQAAFPGLAKEKADSLAYVLQNDATGKYFNDRLAYHQALEQAELRCHNLLAGSAKLANVDLPTADPVQSAPAPGSSQPHRGEASSAGATAGVVVFSLLAALGVSLAIVAAVGPQLGIALPEFPDLSDLANIQV